MMVSRRRIKHHLLKFAVILLILAICLSKASAENVTAIRYNGSPTNRVDLAILGDGYTAEEMGKYAADVERFIADVFKQEPFKEYEKYFNVYRVDVISRESGADHPSRGIYKDTALDATYESGGIARLEYDSEPPPCNNTVEPRPPNVTKETKRNAIKWNYGGGPPTGWIEPNTPVPTSGTALGVPGLYEGAMYCKIGLFRPTYNSKMRSLYRPFEQINEEQLIKRIYNWVSPLDSWSPEKKEWNLLQGESISFQVSVPEPLSHPLEVGWYVDGVLKGTALTFDLNSGDYSRGTHTVEVRVNDPTAKVRYDPEGMLIESFIWSIIIYKPIYPPLEFKGKRVMNRSVLQVEYINVLTWSPNPKNGNISGFRLYQVENKNLRLLAELNQETFEYRHRRVQKDKIYEYALVTVDDAKVESEPVYLKIQ